MSEKAIKVRKPKAEKVYKRKWGNQFSKQYTVYEIEKVADEMMIFFQQEKNLWLKEFSIKKKFGNQRISEFAAQNDYFAYILGICKDMQESRLFRLGLNKQINGSMPIFALKNVAGWRDKEYIDNGLNEEEIRKLKQIANTEIESNI